VPGTAADNALQLEGRVPEIGLCFFETDTCLAYGDGDIPPAGLRGWDQDVHPGPMRYHVHLPADFDWKRQKPSAIAETAFAVFAKARRLAPATAVLHPPADMDGTHASTLLHGFIQAWRRLSPARILLENIRGAPLVDLDTDLFGIDGFGVCLDAGHLIGYRQDALLGSPLPRQAEIFHWSAPGGGDRGASAASGASAAAPAAGGTSPCSLRATPSGTRPAMLAPWAAAPFTMVELMYSHW